MNTVLEGQWWRGLKFSPQFFLQFILFLSAVSLALSIQRDSSFISQKKQTTRMAFNSELLPHVVLGYHLLASDMLWIRLVQEVDYKENIKVISKGWVFQMIDGITTLDPRFRMAYGVGGTVLSVLIQDVEGGSIIWERAAKNFPSDWSLLYRAGYHFLYEAKDCKRAADMFAQAVSSGAPHWVAALSGRLYMKSGQYEIARMVLTDNLEKFKGSEFEKHIRERLNELEDRHSRSVASSKSEFADCLPPQ